MIDYFALFLIHALLVVAFFRLVTTDALDREDSAHDESERAADAPQGGEGERG